MISTLMRRKLVALGASVVAGACIVLCWPTRPHVSEVRTNVLAIIKANVASVPKIKEQYEEQGMKTSDPPWQLFHGLLARSGDYEIYSTDGEKWSCLDWLLRNASWRRLHRSMALTRQGQNGPAFTQIDVPFEFEDHIGQFLFVLMECGIDPNRVDVRVFPDGHLVCMADFVEPLQLECYEFSDLSWALPVILKWGKKSSWKNRFGSNLDFDTLFIQLLQRQTTSCLGTHWCYGVARATRYAKDKVRAGLLRDANTRLREAINDARTNQDSIGCFSILWSPGLKSLRELDNQRISLADRLSHQGHMLEWLMLAITDAEMAGEEWPHIGIQWLLEHLCEKPRDLDYGGYSHCVHALELYNSRCTRLLANCE